jgi:hypothetical protein
MAGATIKTLTKTDKDVFLADNTNALADTNGKHTRHSTDTNRKFTTSKRDEH